MQLFQYNRLGSEFVNITAWLTLALSAGWLVMGALQFTLTSLFLTDEIVEQIAFVGMQEGLIAPSHLWMLSHLPWLYGWMCLLGLVTCYASFDLLRRRHWARLFFVWGMVLTALGNVVSLVVAWLNPQWVLPPLLLQVEGLEPTWYTVVALVLALSACLIWTAYKFCTPTIKSEFSRDA